MHVPLNSGLFIDLTLHFQWSGDVFLPEGSSIEELMDMLEAYPELQILDLKYPGPRLLIML